MHGVLVIDKPAGLTSAGAVEKVRRTLHLDRAGHGGTLDPIATGVLPVCVGAGTKLAQFLLADDKAYEAEAVLGVETDTLDRTGRVVAERAVDVTRDALLAVLEAHRGEQMQTPPMYSAIKPPRFRIAVACSKGTYIRSLVADLGRAVAAGAHLAELRRTRSGRFTIEQAVGLDRLHEATLIGPEAATGLAWVTVPSALVPRVLGGVQLPVAAFSAEGLEQFQLVDESGTLLAVAHPEAGRTVYDRVFPELHREPHR